MGPCSLNYSSDRDLSRDVLPQGIHYQFSKKVSNFEQILHAVLFYENVRRNRNIASKTRHRAEERSPPGKRKDPGV